MALAIVSAGSAVAKSLNDAGKSMTEALGGFWQSTAGPEPTFVPLDEFISKKFMEDMEADLASHELVLEDALDVD